MLRDKEPEINVERALDRRYMTADGVAGYLGLSKVSIYRMVRGRKIPFIPMFNGHDKRFDRKAIDDWMAKRTIKPRVV